MQQALTVKPLTFPQFVFLNHRQPLLLALLGMVTLFVVYKMVYPFPDTYVDSYHYLHLAEDSNFITVWPMGYSYFLRAVHFITPSHYFLVAVQFVLLQAGCLWLAFTLFYIFPISERIKNTILVFLVINPLNYYLANLISSDILFTALSIAWITILVKMLLNAKYWHVLVQGALLAYLFMVRYQAAYYPIVMIVALWFAPINRIWKFFSAAIGLLLLWWIISVTRQKNQRLYGRDEFSAQSGWILANNAMYMYSFIQIDTLQFSDKKLVQLNQFVHAFLTEQGLIAEPYRPWDGPQYMLGGRGGVMWNHLGRVAANQPDKPILWHYNRMGQYWSKYGKNLIREHPFAYFRYYLLPNVLTYLLPLPEQFKIYSMGTDKVPRHVAKWFGWSSRKVAALWPAGSFYLLWVLRPLFLLLNIALLITGVLFWKRYRKEKRHFIQRNILIVLSLAFLGNAGLLIIAAPVMLRYQAFAWITGVLLLAAMAAAVKKQAI